MQNKPKASNPYNVKPTTAFEGRLRRIIREEVKKALKEELKLELFKSGYDR